MPALMTIELRDLHFHAFHGLYPEERKAGNDFRVWLQVDYQPPEEVIKAIEGTINYSVLFDIVQKAMHTPVDLLETLVMDIADTIHVRFPQVRKISVSIHKLHPPIARFTGEVGVKFEKEY
jgi:7,8-dihydroneopterin aldolase/epimerase/oxygenase